MRFVRRGIVLVLALIVAAATLSSSLDDPATAQVDAGMKRALATFAIARGLNAVISLAQGTEITAGIGAEVTMSVGQVLDPVNDLVESFSNLMLLASVAFGVQKVLLTIGQYVYLKWLLVGLLAVWSLLYATGKPRPRWLNQVMLLALMFRFAIAAVTVGTDAVYTHFLQNGYEQSHAGLDAAAKTIDQPDSDASILERLDPRAYLDTVRQFATRATEQIIDLIVVFVLQTLLVPLVLLWAMYAAMRSLLFGQEPDRGGGSA